MISKTIIVPRYQETDKMGIIHHSVYPIWYEVGRTEFCKQVGFPFHKMEERGISQALVNLESKYILPAYYGDELVVHTKLKNCTKVRLEFYYEIYNQNNQLINTGSTLLAWLNKNHRPINVAKENEDIYQLLLNNMEI